MRHYFMHFFRINVNLVCIGISIIKDTDIRHQFKLSRWITRSKVETQYVDCCSIKMIDQGLMCTQNVDRSLVFKSISKSLVHKDNFRKQILSKVSGRVNPGEVLALMGPSGSGKTSLLQVLGGRSLTGVSGQVLLRGVLYNRKTMRHKVAYVLQDDIFMASPILTVRDHLMFAASMRLPETLFVAEKDSRVAKIIEDLGLMHCADSPLFLVSGGERKRTSIGVEILSDPLLLLIDEGTSGLDSAAASSLMKTVRKISLSLSIPVVQAIHQPSTAMFYSFDKLLLLSFGAVAYFGAPKCCMSYLLELGYFPTDGSDVNPADFVLELLHQNWAHTAPEMESKNSRELLVESWEKRLANEESYNIKELIESKHEGSEPSCELVSHKDNGYYPSHYKTQFFALLRRAFRTAKSTRFGILNVSETIILALLVGASWYQTPSDESHLSDLSGFLFLSMLYWFFLGLFQGLLEFLPERTCLKKEREAGMYHLSAYFLAKSCAALPVRVILPSLYFLIAYPMAVANPRPEALFALGAILVLITLVGESIGFLIGTLTIQEDVAISTATIVALGMVSLSISKNRLKFSTFWRYHLTKISYNFSILYF